MKVARTPECPAPFEACLLWVDAYRMDKFVRDLQGWAAETMTRCGPSPTTPDPSHPP